MKHIVDFINESIVNESQNKLESYLNDVCQIWSNIKYDPSKLKDSEIKKALVDFWKWTQQHDDDEIINSEELKNFEKIYQSK